MTRPELDTLADDTKAMTEDDTPAFVVADCDGKTAPIEGTIAPKNGTVTIHSRITGKSWEIKDLRQVEPEHIMDFVQNDVLPGACPNCGSCRTYKVSRIVGYFSRIPNWNPSKLGELKARRKGNYHIA